MMISMIAAVGRRGELGKDNRLLWHLPEDMKYFRRMTLGKPIVMGRKTFESFGAKALPGRKNIVVSRDPDYRAPGAVVVNDIEQALAAAQGAEEVMVIGGASFYRQMLPRAERLYLTRVEGEFEADSWFPELDDHQWQRVSEERHSADERHAYAYRFEVLERKHD